MGLSPLGLRDSEVECGRWEGGVGRRHLFQGAPHTLPRGTGAGRDVTAATRPWAPALRMQSSRVPLPPPAAPLHLQGSAHGLFPGSHLWPSPGGAEHLPCTPPQHLFQRPQSWSWAKLPRETAGPGDQGSHSFTCPTVTEAWLKASASAEWMNEGIEE